MLIQKVNLKSCLLKRRHLANYDNNYFTFRDFVSDMTQNMCELALLNIQ